jgi:hypothetical protein
VSGPVNTEPRPAARERSRYYPRQRTAWLATPRVYPHERLVRQLSPIRTLPNGEQDGTRKSTVRLRCPRRQDEATRMRRPADPGAWARTRTGRTDV